MTNLFTFAACLLIAASAVAAEPFGWRGDGSGRFANCEPPTQWSKDSNIVWKASLPGRGYNSPAYSDGRLFVTAEPAHVLCLDAESGKELWRGVADYAAALGEAKAAEIAATYEGFEAEKRTARKPFEKLRKTDPEAKESAELKQQLADIDQRRNTFEKQFPPGNRGGTGNATATPVTDGKQVFVAFATGVVAGFDLTGERLWVRHVEASSLGFGHSASPLLVDGKLVVHFQNMIALDPGTGEEVWRVALPPKHGSPVVTTIDGESVIVTPSGALVQAANGKLLAEKLFDLSENSPLVHDGVIYAHQSSAIKAMRLPKTIGEAVECEILWETKAKGEQRMASAAYHDGLLYAGNRRGILDVTDAESGKLLYQKRLQVGELFPSVTVAGDQLFVSGSEGRTVVLAPGEGYEEVGSGELERFSSSPIFVANRMYVRTDNGLYCVGVTGKSKFVSAPE